jgi:MFS family permease
MSDRLFTPRFVIMFCYSFTVFVSLFQLLPTAPYRIIDLGGSTGVAGMFLGLLTFSSAASAPFTGPLADRLGHRRVLIVVSLILTCFTASYAFIASYKVMLGVVAVHGLIWSGLLSASGAYMTSTIPAARRAEGISYWGLASVLSIGAAPALGFWVYHHGWTALCIELSVLNLLMAIIAWYLPDDRAATALEMSAAAARIESALTGGRVGSEVQSPAGVSATNAVNAGTGVEWRVLFLSIAMALMSFGYGALTSFSALFADQLGVAPRSLFLTAMAAATLVGRLTIGRRLDRIGHRHVLLRCFLAPPVGLALLAMASGRVSLVVAAVVFGAGFGLTHPAYTAYVMNHVPATRRGAAFGAMLAAFDTGVGLGSTTMGWLVQHVGYRASFGTAAAIAALSVPYFVAAERRLGFK